MSPPLGRIVQDATDAATKATLVDELTRRRHDDDIALIHVRHRREDRP